MTTEQTAAVPEHIHNPVDHDVLMATNDGRLRLGKQKLAVLELHWNPYGAGVFGTPSSGIAKAPRSALEDGRAHLNPTMGAILDEPTIVECYESEIPQYRALVEPDMEDAAKCFSVYDRKAIEKVQAAMPRATISKNRAHWTEEMHEVERTMGATQNPAAQFHDSHRRGILPLREVKVIAHSLTPQMTVDESRVKALVDAQKSTVPTAEAIGEAIGKALAAGADTKTGGEAVAKKLAAKDREIEELKAKLAAK